MSTHVKSVNEQNFNKEVLQSEQPVLVDFYADW
ncbi:MAG: thiol reductase thioredoxin, partial [Gammaproteobacteria bacterium]|nr:thiol reductase thioredoxin [Gammaproteobacteria bacterium]